MYDHFAIGFVVKTRTENGEKVFLNVCHTEEIPAPLDINDAQLIEIMQSEEPSSYRLPLSIGDLHEEPDRSKQIGVSCNIFLQTTCFLM